MRGTLAPVTGPDGHAVPGTSPGDPPPPSIRTGQPVNGSPFNPPIEPNSKATTIPGYSCSGRFNSEGQSWFTGWSFDGHILAWVQYVKVTVTTVPTMTTGSANVPFNGVPVCDDGNMTDGVSNYYPAQGTGMPFPGPYRGGGSAMRDKPRIGPNSPPTSSYAAQAAINSAAGAVFPPPVPSLASIAFRSDFTTMLVDVTDHVIVATWSWFSTDTFTLQPPYYVHTPSTSDPTGAPGAPNK